MIKVQHITTILINSSVINKLITWPGRATFFECCIRWVPIHRVWDFNLKLKLTQQIIKWVNWNYFCVCFFDYVFSKFCCIKSIRFLGKQSEVYWPSLNVNSNYFSRNWPELVFLALKQKVFPGKTTNLKPFFFDDMNIV